MGRACVIASGSRSSPCYRHRRDTQAVLRLSIREIAKARTSEATGASTCAAPRRLRDQRQARASNSLEELQLRTRRPHARSRLNGAATGRRSVIRTRAGPWASCAPSSSPAQGRASGPSQTPAHVSCPAIEARESYRTDDVAPPPSAGDKEAWRAQRHPLGQRPGAHQPGAGYLGIH